MTDSVPPLEAFGVDTNAVLSALARETMAKLIAAEKEIERLRAVVDTHRWADGPLPEDEAIAAAHPLETDRHDLYMEAMRMVGAKRSKAALVELVNWLLSRIPTQD